MIARGGKNIHICLYEPTPAVGAAIILLYVPHERGVRSRPGGHESRKSTAAVAATTEAVEQQQWTSTAGPAAAATTRTERFFRSCSSLLHTHTHGESGRQRDRDR